MIEHKGRELRECTEERSRARGYRYWLVRYGREDPGEMVECDAPKFRDVQAGRDFIDWVDLCAEKGVDEKR